MSTTWTWTSQRTRSTQATVSAVIRHCADCPLQPSPLRTDLTCPRAARPPDPAGSWYMGSLHLITAVIGAGVLSLPKAMAWLGLVIGIPLFVVFFCITM